MKKILKANRVAGQQILDEFWDNFILNCRSCQEDDDDSFIAKSVDWRDIDPIY